MDVSDDRIQLRGMTFFAYHGVNDSEKEQGQRFVVDVEMVKDLRRPGHTDALGDTVDYSSVFRTVKRVVEGASRNLIERVAEEVARAILAGYEVESVRVVVKKPDVPIEHANLDYAAVEIVRTRSDGDMGGSNLGRRE